MSSALMSGSFSSEAIEFPVKCSGISLYISHISYHEPNLYRPYRCTLVLLRQHSCHLFCEIVQIQCVRKGARHLMRGHQCDIADPWDIP